MTLSIRDTRIYRPAVCFASLFLLPHLTESLSMVCRFYATICSPPSIRTTHIRLISDQRLPSRGHESSTVEQSLQEVGRIARVCSSAPKSKGNTLSAISSRSSPNYAIAYQRDRRETGGREGGGGGRVREKRGASIQKWFHGYSSLFPHRGRDGLALLSCHFHERMPHRVYGLGEKRVGRLY